jgi:hypothetical protein
MLNHSALRTDPEPLNKLLATQNFATATAACIYKYRRRVGCCAHAAEIRPRRSSPLCPAAAPASANSEQRVEAEAEAGE